MATTTMTLADGAAPVLKEVYRAAYESGADAACRRLLALRDDLQRPARIPVVGERSRGKSSLINAMLRRPGLLPIDVDVSSNVFVVLARLHDGDEEHVEVSFSDGQASRRVPLAELGDYASELGNPDNEKGVQSVTVRVGNALTARGLELVDTPGVGGLVSEHGSMAFEAVRQADGLVMVLEAAKPVSRPEIDFISLVAEQAGDVRVVFCLTKADQYQGADLAEMTRFLSDALAQHAPALSGSPAVCVSAERLLRTLETPDADPERRRELAEQSGLPELLRAVSGHLLGGLEEDRLATVLGECRRITDELARPHRERLAALTSGGDPRARLEETRRRLAALPDSRRLRAQVTGQVDQLLKRADRDLRTRLQAMNNDLEDRITYHWKRSLRRTLPTEYDARFREIWLAVVNDFNDGVAGLARDHADALGEGVPGTIAGAVTTAELKRSKRTGRRIRGWARIAWMSLVSMGFMFPVQYMEHREAMRTADKTDALRWLRRCVQLQAGCRDVLRDHAADSAAKLVGTVEPPVADRRRSLQATLAALENLDAAGGTDDVAQRVAALDELAARIDGLLAREPDR